MIDKLLAHDRSTMAQAITLIESTRVDDQEKIDQLFNSLPPSTQPFIIGISGTPGVGKSTFIDIVGLEIAKKGPLAVLTIDPSSHLTGGSILGDKARMEKLAQHAEVYIRPSPSKGTLGGLSPKTALTLDFLSRLNFKTIIIESVGVGQSEIDLAALSDFFILMLAPGGGDDLQGIKRGVLEVADCVIINKEDQNPTLAQQTCLHYQSSLHVTQQDTPTEVLCFSAITSAHLDEVMSLIEKNRIIGRINSARKRVLYQDYMLNAVWETLKPALRDMVKFNESGYAQFKNIQQVMLNSFQHLKKIPK